MTAQSTRPTTITIDGSEYQLTWRHGSCTAQPMEGGRVVPGHYASVLWPPAYEETVVITATMGGTDEHRARVAEALRALVPQN